MITVRRATRTRGAMVLAAVLSAAAPALAGCTPRVAPHPSHPMGHPMGPGMHPAAPPPSGPSAAQPAADGSATLAMHDFAFRPERLELAADQAVTLTVRNEGRVPHELMIGREPKRDGGYARDLLAAARVEVVAGQGYRWSGAGGHAGHGAELLVEAGGHATLRLEFPADAAGEWELGCFLPGHYEAGMKGVLVVR